MVFKGYALIVAAAVLWGMIGPFSRLAFQEGISPMEVAFWRALLAWILFGGHAMIRNEVSLHRKDVPYILVFGVFGVSMFYYFYQMAVKSGGAALAAVLLYTAPAWVIVLSRIFLKESITPAKISAVVLTLIGISAISMGRDAGHDGGPVSVSAIVFGLSSGFCYSLYYIFGKYFSGRYSSYNLFLYVLPIGALGLLPWVTFAPKTPTAWLALISLVIICTYGANSCYYSGLKYLEAGRASITATLEPVVAAAVAFFWWGEVFTLQSYMGSAVILSAVVLMIRSGGKKS
ncbi:MAG: EamA family transporter [Desulfatirhabdiaceae bacterium]|nr:EamA family transporter [Desulfatirhabdiaceae bacterium]